LYIPIFNTSVSLGVYRSGGHKHSVRAVVERRADVLALDCNVLRDMRETAAGQDMLANLRPIQIPTLFLKLKDGRECQVSCDGLLGPNPAQPIVIAKRLCTDTATRIKRAFLALSPDALKAIGASKFMEVTEEYYSVRLSYILKV